MFWSSYVPCAQCGEAIERASTDSHDCDPQRRVEFQVLAQSHKILTFDSDLHDYLSSNEGRFQVWLASRDVRRSHRGA